MKKIYLIPLVLGLLMLGLFVAEASDTGALLADSAANDASVGTTNWGFDVTTALIDDANGPNCGCRLSGAVSKSSIRLFVGGVPVGDDKSDDGSWVTGLLTLGGASDLWGLTPTAAEINAIDFGIGISAVGNGGTSKYLYISDFDFAIPTGATINGIEAGIDVVNNGNPFMDYVSIKVYYTEAVVADTAIATSTVHINNGTIIINNGTLIQK